jgi:hypothetical protein
MMFEDHPFGFFGNVRKLIENRHAHFTVCLHEFMFLVCEHLYFTEQIQWEPQLPYVMEKCRKTHKF